MRRLAQLSNMDDIPDETTILKLPTPAGDPWPGGEVVIRAHGEQIRLINARSTPHIPICRVAD
jgi:hypothetical protein